MKNRIYIEDALKHLYKQEYQGQAGSLESVAGVLGFGLEPAGRLLATLQTSELVVRRNESYRLTRKGRRYAAQVVRAHRLYETYLAQQTGYREEDWHQKAESQEHRLSPPEVDRISRELGHPRFDPHGDPIPTASGDLPPAEGWSLQECAPGWEGRILHVEDEPRAVFAKIVAAGLAPDVRLRVIEVSAAGVRILVNGRERELSLPMAANIEVSDLEPEQTLDDSVGNLNSLREGRRATVVGLSPACRGAERSRLLDLGLVPGTVVEKELENPSGSPAAYRIRGALIALRREQGEKIMVRATETAEKT